MALWYVFTRTAGADPLDRTNYAPGQVSQPACPGTGKICAILADDDGFGYPIITQAIEDDMVWALQFGVDQPKVILRSM